MFIAAVVTITGKQRQPRCLATDTQIMKIWCAYTMECYSAIKKIYEMHRCGGLNENSSHRCIQLNTRSLVVVLIAYHFVLEVVRVKLWIQEGLKTQGSRPPALGRPIKETNCSVDRRLVAGEGDSPDKVTLK